MAVHHADGTVFVCGMLCPIAAGLAAVSAGVGWFMVGVVVAAVPVGFAIAFVGKRIVSAVPRLGLRLVSESANPWTHWVACRPLFVA